MDRPRTIPDWTGSGGGALSLIGTIREWCGLVSIGSAVRARTIPDWSGRLRVASSRLTGAILEWTGITGPAAGSIPRLVPGHVGHAAPRSVGEALGTAA